MKYLLFIPALCLATTAHADTARLHINGPDGKPIAGAKVRVVEAVSRYGELTNETFVDLRSDANGEVMFQSKSPLPLPTSSPTLTGTRVQARVIVPGMAATLINIKSGKNTLTLKKGQGFGGVVLDENDQPIAGVKVSLLQIGPLFSAPNSPALYFLGKQSLETQSDAQGQWHLENVPLTGIVGFRLSDARFKNEVLSLDVAHPAPPLYLERGATVKGRLLRPDGKPAAGVTLYASYGSESPKTKVDGTFQVGGISEGTLYLQPSFQPNPKFPFIVPTKRVSGLEPGEVRDIGDLKAVPGIRLRGKAVAAITQKPVPGAWISVSGKGPYSNGQTDTQGNFDLVVSPGSATFAARAPGFLDKRLPKLPKARNGIIEIGTLVFTSGPKVSGTLKTLTGQGIAATITARKPNGQTFFATSDEKGQFELSDLEAGIYTVSAQGHKLKSRVKLELKAGATSLPPIRLVAIDPPQTPTPRTVTGRVLCNGEPVAGVKIRMMFRAAMRSYMGYDIVSGRDGVYTMTSSMPNTTPTIIGVTRPGYNAEFGKPIIKDGVWRGDITLQKRVTLSGRIVDSVGKPVSGAFVTWDKDAGRPVATSENGEFALKDAPSTGVTLLACDGLRWQTLKIEKESAEGRNLEIVLPDAKPIADKALLAEQIVPDSSKLWAWAKQLSAVNSQPAGEALVRFRVASNTYGDGGLRGTIALLAERNPTQFLEKAAELQSVLAGDDQPAFERLLMLARASSKDTALRAQAAAWLSEEEKKRREISVQTIRQLLGVAQVAQKLDAKQGTMWSEYAAQLSDQIPNSDQFERSQWGILAARVSPLAVDMLMEESSPRTKLRYLAAAMQTYKERDDSTSARQTFAKMGKLVQQASQNNKAKNPRAARELNQLKSELNQSREQLIRTIAPADPAAAHALILAAPASLYQRIPVLLLVAQSALKQNKPELASKALKSIPEEQLYTPELCVQAAQVASQLDPKLAEELFSRAFRQVNPKRGQSDDYRFALYEGRSSEEYRPSIAEYAKARAASSPGESRLLIEREWIGRREYASKQKQRYAGYTNSEKMQALVIAMAAVDPQRALEMLPQIPDDYGFRGLARGEIAIALLKK